MTTKTRPTVRTANSHAAKPVEKPAEERGTTLDLPGVSVRLSPPELPQVAQDAVRKVRSVLPPPKQVAFYAGLGLLAALQVIEWPVAAVVGVGMALSGQEKAKTENTTDGGEG